jgi:hypothetical protein
MEELTTYVYLVDGELNVGTLVDYAKAWERAHYADLGVSNEVRTWDASYKVEVEFEGTDGEAWMHYKLAVNGEEAYVTIDGLA